MEFDLQRTHFPAAQLPSGYVWSAWTPQLVERHAAVKYASFRDELDSQVFPCLGELSGCHRLMRDIAERDAFCRQATWMISRRDEAGHVIEDCATIQGMVQSGGIGAIQNVGVAPPHRGSGLGRALVLKCLAGFHSVRMTRVTLEVTARNLTAVYLYRSIGFRLVRTTYKAVEQPASTAEPLTEPLFD
jgi:GNAT superfamily N-acetyltransferase